METYAGMQAISLSVNRRQKQQAHREAIALLRQGRAEEGLSKLDQLKAVLEIPDEEQRYRHLAEDYVHALKEKKEVMAVSPTRAEGEQITTAIRQVLREGHKLRVQEKTFLMLYDLRWSTAQRRETCRYEPGMVVQFHRDVDSFTNGEQVRVIKSSGSGVVMVERSNGEKHFLALRHSKHFQVFCEKQLGLAVGDRIRIARNGKTLDGQVVNNGEIHQIKGFTQQGDIRLTNNLVIPKGYGNLTYGYCVTSHTSQGKTVDQVLIAQSGQSGRAAYREQFYVSASRFRESIRIYTDNKGELQKAILKSGRRIAALDMVKGLKLENEKITPLQRAWQSVFQANRQRMSSLLKFCIAKPTFAEILSKLSMTPSPKLKIGF